MICSLLVVFRLNLEAHPPILSDYSFYFTTIYLLHFVNQSPWTILSLAYTIEFESKEVEPHYFWTGLHTCFRWCQILAIIWSGDTGYLLHRRHALHYCIILSLDWFTLMVPSCECRHYEILSLYSWIRLGRVLRVPSV